ncbi:MULTISPECIES: helix-turn-helix domain-containing protein [Mumia]|uniref:helix-turn-helix domain-containing protein n=1 Tax=Mumia TaxID=1546255 RepID=UPI001422E3D6|nr:MULTISPECIES: helix-turn-helix domain-containing protein [unclassified Mumia]QMW64901.1 helix-turn-helix domain-containing protein [Mumia sp. ZJ1417]
MTKRTRMLGRPTLQAVEALGHQVAAARRRRGWTAAELAERLGVSPGTVRKIESGNPTVAVGLMFEAAVLSGVELYGVQPGTLGEVVARTADQLALLPQRVRTQEVEFDDDF